MKIWFSDHYQDKHIGSLEAARVRSIAQKLKNDEVGSIEEADVVLAHYDYPRICALIGYYPFDDLDVKRWHELAGRLLEWDTGDLPSGRLIDLDTQRAIQNSVESGNPGPATGPLIESFLNNALQRADLRSGLSQDETGRLPADAVSLLRIEPSEIQSNELFRLNRFLLEAMLPELDPPANAKAFDQFPKRQVVVLVTTQAGFNDEPPWVHTRLSLHERTRWVLFVREMSELADQDDVLAEVLSLTPETADLVVRAQTQSISPSLVRLFFSRQADLIQALLTLCVAYLCVHAETTDDDPNREKALAQALNDIALGDMLKRVGGRGQEIRASLLRERERVCAPEWWLGGLGVNGADQVVRNPTKILERELKEQWESDRRCALPRSAKQLLEALQKRAGIRSPALVAQLYNDLRGQLPPKTFPEPVQ